MREADSFYNFENLIYQESLRDRKEKLFLTSGRLFMEIGTKGDNKGVDVDLVKESEFLEEYQGVFVYSYHTHIKKIHLDGYPEPPSFSDFYADQKFRKRALEKRKRIISRVLEIWSRKESDLRFLGVNEVFCH